MAPLSASVAQLTKHGGPACGHRRGQGIDGENTPCKRASPEFDRVLGGGLVGGTLVLIGGDPGIGKSTLMLQALFGLAGGTSECCMCPARSRSSSSASAASGWPPSPNMLVVSEIDLDAILSMVAENAPRRSGGGFDPDHVQPELALGPGQRQPGAGIGHAADADGQEERRAHLPGGPRDQGRRSLPARACWNTWWTRCSTSRATATTCSASCGRSKTAFGSTNEIGVFEMKAKGLDEVATRRPFFSPSGPKTPPDRWSPPAWRAPGPSGGTSGPGQQHQPRHAAAHHPGAGSEPGGPAGGGDGKKARHAPHGPRHLHERGRRRKSRRAGRGPGHRGGPGLQFSGQAPARRHHGARRGGAHR
jgi:hypothetical protein